MIIVSACLVGQKCRYDGGDCFNKKVKEFVEANKEQILLVCPEELGGLKTPRVPCEIVNNQVIGKNGNECTKEFELGAKKVLKLAQENQVKQAILKSKSPSCGSNQIYDGTFQGHLVQGDGITAQLLKEHGIIIITEEEM